MKETAFHADYREYFFSCLPDSCLEVGHDLFNLFLTLQSLWMAWSTVDVPSSGLTQQVQLIIGCKYQVTLTVHSNLLTIEIWWHSCSVQLYILCKVVHADSRKHYNINERDIYTTLNKEVSTLHGEYAIASLKNTPGFAVRYLDSNSGIVLIRCQRSLLKIMQSSIVFVKKIGREEAFLQTIHVGGTVRSSLKFLLRYHRSLLPQLLMECKTEEDKKRVQAAIVTSCQRNTQVLKSWERREKSETSKPDMKNRQEKSEVPDTWPV